MKHSLRTTLCCFGLTVEVSSHERSFYYFFWTGVLALFSHLLGLIFGNVDQDDYFMRNLSIDLQVTTLNVEYRFVPEYPSLHLIICSSPSGQSRTGSPPPYPVE